jgi:predicted esterase
LVDEAAMIENTARSRIPIWVALATAALVGAATTVGYELLRSRPAAAGAESTGTATTELPDVPPADWCAPEFEPIAGGGCLATPLKDHAVQALVVYLHGRYARDVPGDEVDRQRRLGARAKARGFAVLAPRGLLGACAAPELADWFCWPTATRDAGATATFVDTWTRALASAKERTGSVPRVLLGFSNGGYFAGLLASLGLLDVDAVVVAHGGPVDPFLAPLRKPPVLLLSADDDVAQDDMLRLDEELGRQAWPHDGYARQGAHGLTDADIDLALTFFERRRETLPLDPPLSQHRAARHARDAAPTPAASAQDRETAPDEAGPYDESDSGS